MLVIAIDNVTTGSNAPAKMVINRDRMETALKGKRTKIPAGLSREEKRQFILNNG